MRIPQEYEIGRSIQKFWESHFPACRLIMGKDTTSTEGSGNRTSYLVDRAPSPFVLALFNATVALDSSLSQWTTGVGGAPLAF